MSKEWKASWSIIIGLLTFTPAVLYALGFHVMPEAFFLRKYMGIRNWHYSCRIIQE